MDRRKFGAVDTRWRLRRLGGAPGFRGVCADLPSCPTQTGGWGYASALVDDCLVDRACGAPRNAIRSHCSATYLERRSGMGLSSPGRAPTSRGLCAPREFAAAVHLDAGGLLVLHLGGVRRIFRCETISRCPSGGDTGTGVCPVSWPARGGDLVSLGLDVAEPEPVVAR